MANLPPSDATRSGGILEEPQTPRRCITVMSRSWILVLLALASALTMVFIGNASGGAARAGTERAGTPRETTVYFLTKDAAAPLGVRRTSNREPAGAALAALLAGPTTAERKRGLRTAIPEQARLVSLTLTGRQRVVAVVNLAGLPLARGRQGEEATLGMRVRVITQIARTLIGVSGIVGVKIRAGGSPWDLWRMDGGIVDRETNYDTLRSWTVICGGRSSAERKLGLSRCFSALP